MKRDSSPGQQAVATWLSDRGWQPASFQRKTWEALADGESGLLHAPTGSGKTLAIWLGVLARALDGPDDDRRPARQRLRWLWITPLRALSADSERAISLPTGELLSNWEIQRRTGDTAARQRGQWARHSPEVLLTTPESLSLLLSYPDAPERFGCLEGVVVDEWHELLGSKRGTQTELALSRLRFWNRQLLCWGLSATLGNLNEAARALVGPKRQPRLVSAPPGPPPTIETIAPADIERFPWGGHLGARLVDEVIARIEAAATTLVFVNTRSQVEQWMAQLLERRPDWEKTVAAHHGNLARSRREEVEAGIATGTLRAVVCTSTLDLGIDFAPVEQVLQLGSPKGIARLLQRAGRSGHRPGEPSHLVGVPNHAFELVEYAAAREAVQARRIEARRPLSKPLDVLVQHLVTCALGGSFSKQEIMEQLADTTAFENLKNDEINWALTFVTRGGEALSAYPEFRRVRLIDNRYRLDDPQLARRHRMSIGTIVSQVSVTLKLGNGRPLGNVEESFIGRLRPGETFRFGGRLLELVRVRGLTATVRVSQTKGRVTSWSGAKFPFTTALAEEVQAMLGRVATDEPDKLPVEVARLQPLFELQRRWSCIPRPDELLVETTETREGEHWFVFTFAGWLGNEGLAQLVSWRLARAAPRTLSTSINDYGFELASEEPLALTGADWRELLSPQRLAEHLLESLNATEMARRQFREISRVAGLVFEGLPNRRKSDRQLQMSSGLIFDVLSRYDPDNLLLEQSRREILERQLDLTRLRDALDQLQRRKIIVHPTPRLSPLAFPLWAQWVASHHLSTENPAERIARMVAELEDAAE